MLQYKQKFDTNTLATASLRGAIAGTCGCSIIRDCCVMLRNFLLAASSGPGARCTPLRRITLPHARQAGVSDRKITALQRLSRIWAPLESSLAAWYPVRTSEHWLWRKALLERAVFRSHFRSSPSRQLGQVVQTTQRECIESKFAKKDLLAMHNTEWTWLSAYESMRGQTSFRMYSTLPRTGKSAKACTNFQFIIWH